MNMCGEKCRTKKTRHRVLAECAHLMCIPILINAVAEVFMSTLLVVTANTLGKFTEAAFNLDIAFAVRNIWLLIGCIMLSVTVAPLLALWGDFIMLKYALRHDIVIFDHFFDKEPECVAGLKSGELQYELEDAPNSLRIEMVILLSKAIAVPLCLGYLLFYSGRVSWLLTGLLFLLAAARLVIPVLFRKKLAQSDAAAKAYYAKRRGYEADIISSPHLIKLWGICVPVRKRVEHLFEVYYAKSGTKYDSRKVLYTQTNTFVDSFTLMLLFVIGAAMVAGGHVSSGQFASVLVYLNIAQTILGNAGEIIQRYPMMINAANRVTDFYNDPELADGQDIRSFEGIKGHGIEFAYGDNAVIKGIDFELLPGDKIAIIGKNGSGKSTLGKIIATLIKGYGGIIEVNGVDVKGIIPIALRRIISYAPQSPYLFEATVRENVCMGDSEDNKKTVDKLLYEFGILPLADRKISNESELSGGERQKISIIRALQKKADLLILDEPTNHLDWESIQTIKKYITETTQTVLVISHDQELSESIKKVITV